MGTKHKATAPAGAPLPEFKRIPIAMISEPDLPARTSMTDAGMQDLIESLRAIGQIEPVTVEDVDGAYKIVTGHRRLLAARSLGWTELAAMVYPFDQSRSAAMMLHENIVREDLNPAEEALYMAQVRERFDLDEEGLCKFFKRSAGYIGSRFALLRGDQNIFLALQRGEIRVGVAHELNRITADDMRAYYLDIARRSDPPQKVVHEWVQSWMNQVRAPAPPVNGGTGAAVETSMPENAGTAGVEVANPNPQPEVQPTPPFFGCQICGGTKDPYNLVSVLMHKWHWDDIQASLRRAGGGG